MQLSLLQLKALDDQIHSLLGRQLTDHHQDRVMPIRTPSLA